MRPKPIKWNGKTYKSIADAAQEAGISREAMRQRLKRGLTEDAELLKNRPKVSRLKKAKKIKESKEPKDYSFEYEGKTYESKAAFAREFGINLQTLLWRIRNGRPLLISSPHRTPRQTEWNGVIYESLEAAAKANGVKTTAMAWRLAQGYKSDEEVPKPGNPSEIEWEGQTFSSILEAANYFGLSWAGMQKRLKKRYREEGINFQGKREE